MNVPDHSVETELDVFTSELAKQLATDAAVQEIGGRLVIKCFAMPIQRPRTTKPEGLDDFQLFGFKLYPQIGGNVVVDELGFHDWNCFILYATTIDWNLGNRKDLLRCAGLPAQPRWSSLNVYA